MAKISIIVPVYNVAKYLPNCIDSIINQSLNDIEIIVVDDCSTDDSLKILENYASKDSRIKILHNNMNFKTAYSRNRGIENASGEYLLFIDGDDCIDLDFCEKLYNIAHDNNADIVKGLTKSFYQDGKIVKSNDNKKIKEKGKFYFQAYLLSAIYKRDLIEHNNIRFHIDFFCFLIQAVWYANKVLCCDNTFYNYIRHDGSCDSNIFTIEKWQRLNLGHANFIYRWVLSHNYDEPSKEIYLNRVRKLYFHGFNRLKLSDAAEGSKILANMIFENYDCNLNISNKTKLKRILYKMQKQTNWLTYILCRIKGDI